jgi:hypothetical protein
MAMRPPIAPAIPLEGIDRLGSVGGRVVAEGERRAAERDHGAPKGFRLDEPTAGRPYLSPLVGEVGICALFAQNSG